MELWAKAGAAAFGAWRLETGQGMGATLRIADEKGAYCLADRASFYALEAKLKLKLLHEGGEELLNRYRVIAVNPAKHPSANVAGARAFAAWLTSPVGQALIGAFKKDGRALFTPDAEVRVRGGPPPPHGVRTDPRSFLSSRHGGK
jgi:tungstate transport system substrate-binding protein